MAISQRILQDPITAKSHKKCQRTRPCRTARSLIANTIHYHNRKTGAVVSLGVQPGQRSTGQCQCRHKSIRDQLCISDITPEILANRLGMGPTKDCVDCKFEEFFLSSWAGGDPAMIVDNPANLPCTGTEMLTVAISPSSTAPCIPGNAPAATKAFYPDDPSNVYHSYLGDHARLQILHAGAAVHHVHHHHAHQWVHTPDSPDTSYLDSQAIGPGLRSLGLGLQR